MEAELTKRGSRYHIVWNNGVEAYISRIRENPERIKCEIALTLNGQLLTRSSPVVTSESGKDGLIRKLQRRRPKEDWHIDHEVLVEQMCALIIDTYREGEPPINLSSIPEDDRLLWRIENILPEQEPTLLYSDGGSGKSMLACMWSVAVDQGVIDTDLGIVCEPGNVLYLDWETSAEEISKRVRAIMRGFGMEGKTGIIYRRCTQPLIAEVDRIIDLCDEYSIDMIVCDSLGLATGGMLEDADSTLQMFGALRMVGKTSLVISHINKSGQNFGSVYANNSARMSWMIDSDSEDDSSGEEGVKDIPLIHKKANTVPQQTPIGWSINFGDDGRSIEFTRKEIYQTSGAKHQSIPKLLIEQLKENESGLARDTLLENIASIKNTKIEKIKGAFDQALRRALDKGLIEVKELNDKSFIRLKTTNNDEEIVSMEI